MIHGADIPGSYAILLFTASELASIASMRSGVLWHGPSMPVGTLGHFCLENPMDRGAWRATVHRVTKSWTQLK